VPLIGDQYESLTETDISAICIFHLYISLLQRKVAVENYNLIHLVEAAEIVHRTWAQKCIKQDYETLLECRLLKN